MKFSQPLILALGLFSESLAHPLDERDVQVAHFTFHGGPASYELAVPADGSVVPTNNGISVNIIDAPDYNAIVQCTFNTAGEKTLVSGISPDGIQQIIVGPPQPIISVSCQGSCVPTYGQCYGTDGQYIGPCCNGFCAATRCRPWNTTTSA
ncbi:hypothetical protein F4775DRAFT_595519 [Biscogniauxia sp. FL1348]|nr:hypothetical protein F4775DRAFT_595519 [Biscogniauxia sp. FL1348]